MLFFEPLLRKYLARLGCSMPVAIPQRDLYEHGPLTTLMLREQGHVRLLQEAGPSTDQSPPPPPPYPSPITLQEAGPPTDQSPPPPPPYPPPFRLPTSTDSSTFIFTNDADVLGSDDVGSDFKGTWKGFTCDDNRWWHNDKTGEWFFEETGTTLRPTSEKFEASAAGSEFKGTWKRFIWDDNRWWHNDETGEWFFEETGTTVRPTSEVFGKCCSKSRTSPASPGGGYQAPYLPGWRPMPIIPEDENEIILYV